MNSIICKTTSTVFVVLFCFLNLGCNPDRKTSETVADFNTSSDSKDIEESVVKPVSSLFNEDLKEYLLDLANSKNDHEFHTNYVQFIEKYPLFDQPHSPFSYLLFGILDLPKRNIKLDTWAVKPAILYLKIFERALSIDNEGEHKTMKIRFASSVLGFSAENRDGLVQDTLRMTVETLNSALQHRGGP